MKYEFPGGIQGFEVKIAAIKNDEGIGICDSPVRFVDFVIFSSLKSIKFPFSIFDGPWKLSEIRGELIEGIKGDLTKGEVITGTKGDLTEGTNGDITGGVIGDEFVDAPGDELIDRPVDCTGVFTYDSIGDLAS